MSVFDAIRDAIFGHAGVTPQPAPAPGLPGSPAVPLPGTVPPTTPPSTQPAVDVRAVLTELAAKQSQQLDWQHSIVDLMKLLGMDSSFQNRAALAKELGYTGNQTDSASMNVWLYQQVMSRLAAAGANVPAVSADRLSRGA